MDKHLLDSAQLECGNLVAAKAKGLVDKTFVFHFLPGIEVAMTPFEPRMPLEFLDHSWRGGFRS